MVIDQGDTGHVETCCGIDSLIGIHRRRLERVEHHFSADNLAARILLDP